jgi:hypothetical protein
LKAWPHPPVLDQYLVALREQLVQRTATLEFIKVLELCQQYSLAEVAQGVAQAMATRSLGADTVAYFLRVGRGGMPLLCPAPLTTAPPCPPVQERDLHQYDLLLRR